MHHQYQVNPWIQKKQNKLGFGFGSAGGGGNQLAEIKRPAVHYKNVVNPRGADARIKSDKPMTDFMAIGNNKFDVSTMNVRDGETPLLGLDTGMRMGTNARSQQSEEEQPAEFEPAEYVKLNQADNEFQDEQPGSGKFLNKLIYNADEEFNFDEIDMEEQRKLLEIYELENKIKEQQKQPQKPESKMKKEFQKIKENSKKLVNKFKVVNFMNIGNDGPVVIPIDKPKENISDAEYYK